MQQRTRDILAGLHVLLLSVDAFFVYPEDLDRTALAKGYGISADCFDALNSTVECDPASISRVQHVDDIYWEPSNISDLCTTRCGNDLQQWADAVSSSCKGQSMPVGGMVVDASYLPLVYRHGFQVACLTSRYPSPYSLLDHFITGDHADQWSSHSSGQNCLQASYEWQGSYAAAYPADYCHNGELNPEECDDPDFDQYARDPDDTRISSLYSRDLVCSDCFMKLWKLRLENPLLGRESGHAMNLKEQYENMQEVCSTSLPASIPSRTVVQGTLAIPDGAPSPTPAPCTGQRVQPNSTSCKELADKYQVPLGAIYAATGGIDQDCTNVSSTLCLPQPCELETLDSPDIWKQTW